MFFLRLVTDRLRGRAEMFGNGGAVAGILSRTGEAVSAATARSGAVAARWRAPGSRSGAGRSLVTRGAWSQRAPRRPQRGSRAAAAANAGMRASASVDWSYLAAPFRVVRDQLDRARHALVRAPARRSAGVGRVAAQVRRFLAELHAQAFASVPADQAFYVICDERINEAREPHIVNILVQFAATHAGEYHSFMISHSVSGATVRPVAVNRLEASR